MKMHDYKIDLEEELSSAQDTVSETSYHMEYIEISDDNEFENELPKASYIRICLRITRFNGIQISLPQVIELRYIIL